MNCPICQQVLEGGELVMVCQSCHKAVGGGLSLGSTGEFLVPTQEELNAGRPDDRNIVRPTTTNVCSWCGKLENQVKKLLGRGGVALCNECVSLASDILEAELGDGWR
ncbi:MAG: ClpX C4-type zinc finger protein [Kofleriaceae bacterium]